MRYRITFPWGTHLSTRHRKPGTSLDASLEPQPVGRVASSQQGSGRHWLPSEDNDELATDCQGEPHWDWKEKSTNMRGKFKQAERFRVPRTRNKSAFTNPGDSDFNRVKRQYDRCSAVMRRPLIDRSRRLPMPYCRPSSEAVSTPMQQTQNKPTRNRCHVRPGKLTVHRGPDGRFGLSVKDGELRTPQGRHRVVSIDGKRLDDKRLIGLCYRLSKSNARYLTIEKGQPRPPKAEQLQQAVIEDEQYEDTTEKIRTPPKNDNVSEESQSRQSSPSGGQTDLTATALSKLTPSQTPRDQPRNLPENAPSEISTSASSAMPDKPVRSMATFGQSKTDRFKAMGGPSGREWPIDPTGPPSRIKGGSIMPLHQSRASAPQQQHHMSNIDPKLELVRERTPSAIIGPESTSAATRRSSTLGPGTYDPSPPSPTRCNTVIKDRVFPVLPPGLSLEGTFHPGPGAYDVSTESSAPGGTLSFQMAQRFSYGRAAEWHDIGGYEKKPQRRRIPSAVILPEGVCLSKMVRQFGPEPATYTPCHADLYRPDVGILQWSRARDVAIRYAHERLFGDSRREIDNLDSKWSALTRPNYDECIRTRKGSLVDYQLSERPAAKYPPHVPTNAGCSDNWHFYDTRPPECNEFTAFFSSKHDFDEWQRVARCRELQQGIARRRENPQAELFAYSLPDLPDGKGVTFAGACHSPTPPDNEGHILILDPQLPCRVGGSLEFQLRTGRESPTEDSGGDVLILSPRKIPKHTGGAIPYELQPARETQLFCHVAGVGSEDQVYTTQPPRETAPDDVPDECLTNFEEVERSRPLGHLPKWLLRMKNRRRSGLPVVFED